ncbi:MAG TPA: helix-turn-helix domain-containing protein [Rhodanobacter sp.]
MNPLHVEVDTPRPLEVLGISEMEERTYRTLLSHRMATAEDIANLLSLPLAQVQPLLDSIEVKGLATHSPERPPRYIASPPELAVEALVSQRQAVLERARLTIPELKEQVSSASTHDREQIVEVITSPSALGQVLLQLRQTIQHEAFGFQCAPLLYPGLINKQEMRPGVRIRSISDAGFLALPGSLESLRLDMERGEEARTFATLPIKMFVADRRIGIIPLNTGDQGGPTLLVRSCALLDALCALFELIWEQATPMVITRSGKLEVGKPTPRLSEAAEQLIPLLAAGLNDKAIAYQAGISATTLNRRIAELMKSSGTRTRFQLGWRAALDTYPHGWLHAHRQDNTSPPR